MGTPSGNLALLWKMDEHDPVTDEIDLSKMVKHVIAVLPFEVSEMEVPWP